MSVYEEMGFKPSKEIVSEAAVYNIARTFTLLNRAFQRLYARFQVTPAKFNVLMLVKHGGGGRGLSQCNLASRLIISGSNVTGLVDRLEKEGLLARNAVSEDRRVKRIKITPQGSALLDKLWLSHLKEIERVMHPLSLEKQKELIALLTEIRMPLQKKEGE